MEVRRLCNGDEVAGCEVVRVHKKREVTPEYMAALLADGRHWLVAALDGDRPVGFALAYELMRLDGTGPKVFLYEIGVVEEWRRRGVGRGIVERLKQLCRERGCQTMFVPTDEANVAAMHLYAATGGVRPRTDEAAFEWCFD